MSYVSVLLLPLKGSVDVAIVICCIAKLSGGARMYAENGGQMYPCKGMAQLAT